MKKEQLAEQLAKESKITKAAAADQLDRIVSDLLLRVRKGQSASLPGLGTFRPGGEEDFQFDRDLLVAPGSRPSKKAAR
ncbi:MAG TPA: HU family DNA-binding protein [Bryobacteraceae bacterium]|nr:HU family DNA-binding protein [Bryobacteraceae bacterium]